MADLELSLEREKRARSTAESEKRAAEARESELVRQASTLRAERAALTVELGGVRHQLTMVQEAHARAAETANKNYAVAKDLEQQLSTAKGFATVTGILGLTMVVRHAFSDDAPAPRQRIYRRTKRAGSRSLTPR